MKVELKDIKNKDFIPKKLEIIIEKKEELIFFRNLVGNIPYETIDKITNSKPSIYGEWLQKLYNQLDLT